MHAQKTEFMWDPIWFSPFNVLVHAEKIRKAATDEVKKTKEYRKVLEAEAAARMLVGISAASKKDYWMQIVDDRFGSPDIRTVCYSDDEHPSFDFLEVQYVEVVEYEDHSTEDLIPFIDKRKFSKRKAYDQNTHILCHLGGETKVYLPNEIELAKQVANSGINCPVLFIGSPDGLPSSTYRLLQLWPAVNVVVQFDIKEEYEKKKPIKYGVMHFERGKRKPWAKNVDEHHYPFENIGFVPKDDGEYRF